MRRIAIGDSTTLTDVEQKLCEFLAFQRFKNNRSKQVTNRKIGPQSNEFTDLEGIGNEFGFCKLCNLYPDLTIATRSSARGEDKNGDVILPNGKVVDVKGTKLPHGRLLAVVWKTKSVDWYALMTGTMPTYTFRGFMKAEDLLNEAHLTDLGHGPTYAANQSELKLFDIYTL